MIGTKGSESQAESTIWDKINTDSVSEFINKERWRKYIHLAGVGGDKANKADLVSHNLPLPNLFPT